MARTEFGGVLAAWVVRSTPADEVFGLGSKAVILPPVSTTLQIFDAPDGALVTDFLDDTGTAVTGISVTSADPYIPRFSGPDDITALWFQAEGGRWLPIPHYTPGDASSAAPGDVMLEGGNVHEYEDSQSVPWLVLKRPNDGTTTTAWSDMLEFQYWDNSTSQYRIGFYVNEKGLLRARGVTASDTVARVMAHPNQSPAVAVFEACLDDNNAKLFQVLTSAAAFTVPVTVPYLVNPLGERLYWGTGDPNEHAAYANYRPVIGSGFIFYNNPPA
jgi:hypothetical protein